MRDKYMMLYEENREFHDYVERLRRPGKKDAGVKLEELLARKTVKDVGDYFESKPVSEQNPGFPGVRKEKIECDCKSC
jgi:hypothetical protein